MHVYVHVRMCACACDRESVRVCAAYSLSNQAGLVS